MSDRRKFLKSLGLLGLTPLVEYLPKTDMEISDVPTEPIAPVVEYPTHGDYVIVSGACFDDFTSEF